MWFSLYVAPPGGPGFWSDFGISPIERDSLLTIVMSQYFVCSDSMVVKVVRSENDTCEELFSLILLSFVAGKRMQGEVMVEDPAWLNMA
jgi:hypothetical protein